MDALESHVPSASMPIAAACRALGASRATLYRRTSPPKPPTPRTSPPPRALTDAERAKVVATLHSAEFVDQPPREVYATLLSRGEYIASIRTMYRVLSALGETLERRRGHVHRNAVKPVLEATAPNQVWTWDITKVRGPERGIYYYVFVVLDLFSRYVVGWLVAEHENATLATHLIAETAARHAIAPGSLALHSDRGSPMTAGSMVQLLATLGIEQSLSRPRVSDDNPHVESHFKTAKYQPDYPGRFASATHVRGWFAQLFEWYNDDHHHEGLALFTPADVFFARVDAVAARRQQALDAAYAAHPERFVQGAPTVARPPTRVTINAPPADAASAVAPAQPESEVPAGGALRPSSAASPGAHPQRRSREPSEPPRATRSRLCGEHGEDGEKAPLAEARTSASSPPRWADTPNLTAICS
jgi:putative transposase